MNCKPGDLAVIVRVEWGGGHEIGSIVRVISECKVFPGAWETTAARGGASRFWDSSLRPIRDNDGTDETLTWAPKKQLVEV